ncbi:MAG: GntR family transcriptional regulator [Actinomycetota bacterium]
MTAETTEMRGWAQDAGPRETAYEFVYRVLRHALLDGRLEGGTRLLQTEIAKQLGVSTTPVREALHKLVSEGLVNLEAGRGAVVHSLSMDEWNEIVTLKALLEPPCLELAAQRIGERPLAELERLYRLMSEEADTSAWVDLNRQFHRVYYEAAESPRLRAILEALQDAEATYVAKGIREHPEVAVQGQKDHAELIEGLRARDAASLSRVIARHVGTTRAPFARERAARGGR